MKSKKYEINFYPQKKDNYDLPLIIALQGLRAKINFCEKINENQLSDVDCIVVNRICSDKELKDIAKSGVKVVASKKIISRLKFIPTTKKYQLEGVDFKKLLLKTKEG